MSVEIKPDSMRLNLQIHAQQDVAVPLPAQLQQWYPEQIQVDGHNAEMLIRQNDGSLWMGLTPGVHTVWMQGRLANQQKFTLPLALTPQRVEATADGWRVDGVYENGRVGPQLEFSRLQVDANAAAKTLQQAALPAFIRIERTLHLGLDWRMTTRVVQLAGADAPVVLEWPLLPGEAVTSADVRVKNGKVLVNMAAGQDSLEWQSLLDKSQALELKAADTAQWSELWRADVSPIWHLEATGIVVVHHQDPQGAWLPEWRPWPGETLRLEITRPQPVPGATLTIDKAQLTLQPGKRSQLVDLTLNLRSSKGGLHTLNLPEQAVLQTVNIDGIAQPIRQKGRAVTLPIRPGAQQVSLNWQVSAALPAFLASPEVDLGIDSVNSHIQVNMAEDRWVLFTLGPSFGPAALIWGLLLVLLALAWGLGRIPVTPLKAWQWFLLLVGLSQLHIAAAMVVVAWLFALGLRGKTQLDDPWRFNALQLGLGGLTLVAMLLLFAAVQQGLPIVARPYLQIAGQLGIDEQQVIERLARLKNQALIKRWGVVVKHRPLGYRANAMIVIAVPMVLIDRIAAKIIQHSCVNLCYQRPQQGERWPYNLYCMIHGKDRDTVLQQWAELQQACELSQYRSEILFSRRCFKQRGAIYQPKS